MGAEPIVVALAEVLERGVARRVPARRLKAPHTQVLLLISTPRAVVLKGRERALPTRRVRAPRTTVGLGCVAVPLLSPLLLLGHASERVDADLPRTAPSREPAIAQH